MTFQEQLEAHVRFAFDHNHEFIQHFYPDEDSPDEYEINYFYMAGECCIVDIKSILVGTHRVGPSTIKTTDYLDWFASFET